MALSVHDKAKKYIQDGKSDTFILQKLPELSKRSLAALKAHNTRGTYRS